MKKYPLIGICIISIFILSLSSFSNVVGYQTIQSINKKELRNENDQKDFLFQTILDIAKNEEIKQIILKSQIDKKGFINHDLKLPIFNNPVLKKNHLKQLFLISLLLSKISIKPKIQSKFEQYQLHNQEMINEIASVIEKDNKLSNKIKQLSNTGCDCENTNSWHFPILCTFLHPLWFLLVYLVEVGGNIIYFTVGPIFLIVNYLVNFLDCYWVTPL